MAKVPKVTAPTEDKALSEVAAERDNEAARRYVESRRRGLQGVRVGLPFGKTAPAAEYYDIKYDFHRNWWMDNPERLLDHPEPGFHYAWPDKRDPGTQAKINAQIYVKVTKDELKQRHGAGLTHDGTDDSVQYYNHILVKMRHDVWLELYDAPAKFGLTRLARQEESFRGSVEQESRGLAEGIVEKHIDRG